MFNSFIFAVRRYNYKWHVYEKDYCLKLSVVPLLVCRARTKVCINRYGIYIEKYSGLWNDEWAVEPGLQKWQNEVDAIQQEAQNMYKTYQSDLVFLSAEMKSKREEAIVQKEQEAQDLKRKYFGPEGELFKKRESLMKPIQDEIYNAVKEISEDKGYQMVMDRASSMNIILLLRRSI